MLSPTLTLPTVLPVARPGAPSTPVALAAGGGTATLVGLANTVAGGPVRVRRRRPYPRTPVGATPREPTSPARPPTPARPTYPGHPSDPGPPTYPPGSDPGRHAAAEPPPRGWSPVRAGLVATGSVAALTVALLIGLNLGAPTTGTPGQRRR